MKWTNETRKEAIEMLKSNIPIEEICKKFGMSKSSIILLKSKIFSSEERVTCEICKKEMKQITVNHLLIEHGIPFNDYKSKYPNSKTSTNHRIDIYKSFKNKNKGKTYDEIYGKAEAEKKRKIISEKQTGRIAPKLAGTGISGTRKDTGIFARSTYEANIDRIFRFEGKKIESEFSILNERFDLIDKYGTKMTYQPDRIDVDGLFEKGAYLEIKGYMQPEDWQKICLFREQYENKKLLVISPDITYCDINYKELESKYKDKIPLWENSYQNYRDNPEIYDLNYIEPEITKFFGENYTDRVSNKITDNHKKMIAKKCISYNSVSCGNRIYVDYVNLLKISDRRPGARISTGRYYYELWEIITHCNKKFYITNQVKTTLFYCYQESELPSLLRFFDDNSNLYLKFGPKEDIVFKHIDSNVVGKFERKDILKRIEDCFSHRGIPFTVQNIELSRKDNSKRGALNDYEAWTVSVDNHKVEYVLSNFGNSTSEYNLTEIIKED